MGSSARLGCVRMADGWLLRMRWTVWTLPLLMATLISPGQAVTYVPLDQGPDSWWSRQFPDETDSEAHENIPGPSHSVWLTSVYVGSVCAELEPPGNGSVVVVGNVATYSCAANFSLVNLIGILRPCVDGEWIGPDPVCKRGGPLIDVWLFVYVK